MKYVLGLIIVIAMFYMLHRLALWAENRGWILYRKAGKSSTLGNALLEVHQLLEPSKKHVLEVRMEHSEIEATGEKNIKP